DLADLGQKLQRIWCAGRETARPITAAIDDVFGNALTERGHREVLLKGDGTHRRLSSRLAAAGSSHQRTSVAFQRLGLVASPLNKRNIAANQTKRRPFWVRRRTWKDAAIHSDFCRVATIGVMMALRMAGHAVK